MHQVYCEVCRVGGAATIEQARHFIGQHLQHQSQASGYLGAGDVVARLTGALGIEHCTPCEARRAALNARLPRVWPWR